MGESEGKERRKEEEGGEGNEAKMKCVKGTGKRKRGGRKKKKCESREEICKKEKTKKKE